MKTLRICALLTLLLATNLVYSQDQKKDCEDVVYFKGGSILRGKIAEYKLDGDLVINTWGGVQMRVPASGVKKIVQKCKGDNPSLSSRPYSFQQNGWYHATRLYTLPGVSGLGFGLQHSSGIKINRFLGVGVGAGIENFDPWDSHVTTYPVFAETRGYLLAKNITPLYALGIGYGFSNKKSNDHFFEGDATHWRGGWMAQGHVGYRLGNHAYIQLGIRLQHKTRHWLSTPWSSFINTDQILHRRFDIGVGLLL